MRYIILLIVFLLLRGLGLYAQVPNISPSLTFQVADYEIDEQLKLALESFEAGQIEDAIEMTENARVLAEKKANIQGMAESNYFLGVFSYFDNRFNTSLQHYLLAETIFARVFKDQECYKVQKGLGLLYFDKQFYEKAKGYLTKAMEAFPIDGGHEEKTGLLSLVGQAAYHLENYNAAMAYYGKALDLKLEHQDLRGAIGLYLMLGDIESSLHNYSGALAHHQNARQLSLDLNDPEQLVSSYNLLGNSYMALGDAGASMDNFQKALEVLSTNQKAIKKPGEQKIIVLSNLAATNVHIRKYKLAVSNYQEALKISKENGDGPKEAGLLNLLAEVYFLKGDHINAVRNVEMAIEIAERNDFKQELIKGHKIRSEIYNKEGDYQSSKNHLAKYLRLKGKLDAEQREAQDQLLRKEAEAGKLEGEFKLWIANKEKHEMALSQFQLIAQQKEQELNLLKQKQALQESTLKSERLEKMQVSQALEIIEKELQAEKRNLKIAELEKQKELQGLVLIKKELEEQQKQKAIELLEADQKLKAQMLKEEEKFRQYGYGFLGLSGAMILFLVYGFWQKIKNNQQLRKQKKLIQEKNEELVANEEELKQNMEELEATQEAMARKQRELEKANRAMAENERRIKVSLNRLQLNETQMKSQKETLEFAFEELKRKTQRISDSLRYAERIQTAILPIDKQFNQVFEDHFVIYQPKDLVSGDFYWISHIEDMSFVAVVDCTGHGVPGAFMSMIGNTLLNQIINEQKEFEPDKVLELLQHRLRLVLNQKNSKNVDGMDLGLCCLKKHDDENYTLKFSGAKSPLFYYNGKETAKIAGDKKSIGGWQKGFKDGVFKCNTLEVKKGDMIYLTTDGLIDAGNAKKRRFGTTKLMDLFEQYAHRPVFEQKIQIEFALSEHQKQTDQRDDITFLGIKI